MAGEFTSGTSDGSWWESRGLIALVVLASCVPLLYPQIPPLVDLLGHMGRFEIALELTKSPSLQHYYSFHWLPIGNLGVDFLVRILAPMVGLEVATKCVVVAIPLLTVAGFLLVAREIHGRVPPTAFFAVPFAYGQPFLYGFVNFALSVAFAFLAFALWLRLGREGRIGLRTILFIPISLIVFFAHAVGWGMLGLMCFSAELVREQAKGAPWHRALFHSLVQVLGLAGPLLVMIIWRGHASGPWAWGWFNWGAKLLWIESALRDRWQWLDIPSVLIAILVMSAAIREPRLELARELLFSGLALTAVYLLLPENLFGSAYADMRLVPYVFAVLLLAVRGNSMTARGASSIAAIALGFMFVRLAANTISLAYAAEDQRSKAGALMHIPMGARVVSFVGLACEGSWSLTRDIHLGSLVIIRKQGFSNDQWFIEGAYTSGLKYTQPGYFAADPSQIVLPSGCNDRAHRTIDQALSEFPRHSFDYVWLIDAPPFERQLVKDLLPVWEGPASILYRIPDRPSSSERGP